MLFLHKPGERDIARFLDAQTTADFTYAAVGATNDVPPANFQRDHHRTCIAEGTDAFARARQALIDWQQFAIGWVEIHAPDHPIREADVVAILARSSGLWWLNACRIVYVLNDPQHHHLFGYAYGTLPEHAGRGEERFSVELDDAGRVWYEILAFSQPNGFWSHIGYPYLRRKQNQFARDSTEAMRRAVANRT